MAMQPILLLNIEQGPKAGSSFECKATTTASVGRARASTFQISRDPGISQKHLCFQWKEDEDDDGPSGWTAMDAGSSNGTILNDVLIEPHKRVRIHTGDLIKIGSETTIRVEILGLVDEGVTVPKATKKRGTCNASEIHGNLTTVAVRPTRRAGRATGKASAAQGCESKQLDAMEGDVYQSKHTVVEEDHGMQKGFLTNKAYHGKQHKGDAHGKHQDAKTGIEFSGNNHIKHATDEGHDKQCSSTTAHRHHQDNHEINDKTEEGQGKQCRKVHQEKDAINNVVNGKQDASTEMESTSRDHKHEAKHFTAAPADIEINMTVEQWFHHLMEEGPKYLHKVSESIIQDITLESKQFDEYVMSLS